MNTDLAYERRLDRTTLQREPARQTVTETAAEALAVHRDPSLPDPTDPTARQDPDRTRPTVAWVRPSELHTFATGPWVRRGIDLHAELTRRTRRAPAVAAAKAGRRVGRAVIARPDPVPSREELGL